MDEAAVVYRLNRMIPCEWWSIHGTIKPFGFRPILVSALSSVFITAYITPKMKNPQLPYVSGLLLLLFISLLSLITFTTLWLSFLLSFLCVLFNSLHLSLFFISKTRTRIGLVNYSNDNDFDDITVEKR